MSWRDHEETYNHDRPAWAERFEAKADRSQGPNGCWVWTASVNWHGYGQMTVGSRPNKRPRLAHRLAYELAHGAIPEGLCVLHRCDNPPCVNPAHLFLGTRADNVADMIEKGRQRTGRIRGSQNHLTKLAEGEVRAIRARYAAGGETHKSLAQDYGVCTGTVSNIISRRSWAWFEEAA